MQEKKPDCNGRELITKSGKNIGKKLNAEFLTRNALTIENHSQSMFLKSISENDVKYAFNNCKNKYSLDCHNLNYFFIKKVSDCLTAPFN